MNIDRRYYRPTEVENLRADSAKSKKQLNWFPKISFKDLVKIMVDYDLELIGLSSPAKGKKLIQEKDLIWCENDFSKIKGQKLYNRYGFEFPQQTLQRQGQK